MSLSLRLEAVSKLESWEWALDIRESQLGTVWLRKTRDTSKSVVRP